MGYDCRFWGTVAAAALLAMSACSSRGDEGAATATTDAVSPPTGAMPPDTSPHTTEPEGTGPDDAGSEVTASTEPGDDEPVMFGTLASPCGPGDATIAEGQNGDDGVLRVAVGNDRGNEFVPGLTQEMYDAGLAFAGWCNDQGGIQGLQIEIVDMDGRVTEAASAMEVACSRAFAMVGGGLVFDDQTFPRFHECDMIDFAGYTVTAAKAMSNGMVQPLPSPPNRRSAQWVQWGAETYPDAVGNTAMLYTEIATAKDASDQLKTTMEASGWTVTLEMGVGIAEANYVPFAQQLKDNGITAMSLTGEPSGLALLLTAMDVVDYRPELILQETNHYDDVLLDQAGDAAEGVHVRLSYAPIEEPEVFPAVADYLEMMETYNPGGKIAGLGIQATSSHLMFATAANDCLDSNGGVLERECVLAAGAQITSWTGGGLHAESDPAANEPTNCGLIMEVVDGAWQRVYPEVGGPDDNGDGFDCRTDAVVDIEGTFGDYERGIDPDRPN